VSDWPKRGELSHDVTFERNFSTDNGVAGFAINSDSHHVVYRNNVAWRNGADWAGHGAASGFLCYEGCWHVEWYHNVSLENTDAGFWVEDQLGVYGTPEDSLLVFKNNVAYNNDAENLWAPALVVEGESTWQVIATHNDWSVPPGQTTAVSIRVRSTRRTRSTAEPSKRAMSRQIHGSWTPRCPTSTCGPIRPALTPGWTWGCPTWARLRTWALLNLQHGKERR